MKTISSILGDAVLAEKAWIVNRNNFSEPWYIEDTAFYGDRMSKAKSEAFASFRYDNWSVKNSITDEWEDLTYLNLKMSRAEHYDKYSLNGEILTLDRIEYNVRVKEREIELNQLLLDNPDAYVYIKKGGYYYRSNNSGYTEYELYAGVYPIKDGIEKVLNSSLGDNRRVILINNDEHNKRINEAIVKLESLRV